MVRYRLGRPSPATHCLFVGDQLARVGFVGGDVGAELLLLEDLHSIGGEVVANCTCYGQSSL